MTRPTTAALLQWGARRLRAGQVHFGHGALDAGEEASWLLSHVMRTNPGMPLPRVASPLQVARYHALIDERIRLRRPVAYLLNEAWFAGRRFYVDERVLIPRSIIGEFILERFAPWIRHPRRIRRVLDVGTGSGCIALALARAFPLAQVHASDISRDALAVAARNVHAQRLGGRVTLVHSDLFKGLRKHRYDLIVSNPPYVTGYEFRALPREYRYEPKQALVARARGLGALLELLAKAPDHLTEGGILVLETGNRAQTLSRMLPSVPFIWLTDSAGDGSVVLIDADALACSRGEIEARRRALTGRKRAVPDKAPRLRRRSAVRSPGA